MLVLLYHNIFLVSSCFITVASSSFSFFGFWGKIMLWIVKVSKDHLLLVMVWIENRDFFKS